MNQKVAALITTSVLGSVASAQLDPTFIFGTVDAQANCVGGTFFDFDTLTASINSIDVSASCSSSGENSQSRGSFSYAFNPLDDRLFSFTIGRTSLAEPFGSDASTASPPFFDGFDSDLRAEGEFDFDLTSHRTTWWRLSRSATLIESFSGGGGATTHVRFSGVADAALTLSGPSSFSECIDNGVTQSDKLSIEVLAITTANVALIAGTGSAELEASLELEVLECTADWDGDRDVDGDDFFEYLEFFTLGNLAADLDDDNDLDSDDFFLFIGLFEAGCELDCP